jgi:hypothetical protein
LLWTGFGFAVLALIGVSVCALLPIASHAFRKPSHHASAVAFNAFVPSLSPKGFLPAIEDIHERLQTSTDKMPGSLQRSIPVMISPTLDRPKVESSQSSWDVERARAALERQFASPPAPPPPPTTPPPDDGRGGGKEDFYLTRLSASEAKTILDDWAQRVQAYQLGFVLGGSRIDEQVLAASQQATLRQLESFHSAINDGSSAFTGGAFTPLQVEYLGDSTNDKAQHLYALYSHHNNEPLAIAGGRSFAAVVRNFPQQQAAIVPRGTLEFKYIVVNPLLEERSREMSFLSMKQALGDLAKNLSLTLVFDSHDAAESGSQSRIFGWHDAFQFVLAEGFDWYEGFDWQDVLL